MRCAAKMSFRGERIGHTGNMNYFTAADISRYSAYEDHPYNEKVFGNLNVRKCLNVNLILHYILISQSSMPLLLFPHHIKN